jgi:hypothetical protein
MKANLLSVTRLLFCACFASIVQSQEPPKSTLVNEFGMLPCEQRLAYLDVYAQEIGKEPGSTALVLATPENGRAGTAARREISLVISRFELFKFEDRLVVILGKESNETHTQFWKVPQGADFPKFDGTRWTRPAPDVTKPFIFGWEDEYGLCSTFVPRKYAELILRNPGSRAHLVLRQGGRDTLSAVWFGKQWIKTFTKDYGLPRKRIKVFYAKNDIQLTNAEFWFVPARTK